MTDLSKLAASLTEAQRWLVIASGPDDITGDEGHGVNIGGPQYRSARVLETLGLGTYTHGSEYGDMYWNNASGLALRAYLKGQSDD